MAKLVPVDPFDFVIFGGTGDLAFRKLLPALYHRDRDNQISPDSRILAVSRSPLCSAEYVARAEESLRSQLGSDGLDGAVWRRFAGRIHYESANAREHDSWSGLQALLKEGASRTRVVYLATDPALYGTVADGLRTNGLMTEDMRIVLEKPIGHDYASAAAINDAVGHCFAENQIFRIDHYLGKETVQNLLALRFGNSLFEPLWRRGVIDHVQITVAEDIGVGDRVAYYDGMGALRDMVQNHLLQLVCLVAMEPPTSLDDDAVRDEKLKVLRALKPISAENVRTATVRGQYSAGAIDGQAVPGYADELGDGSSETETFVALKLELENWRWSSVPFYLRTGKRLPQKYSEIVIEFADVPHSIFDDHGYDVTPNRLSIRLQPDEGVKLSIMAKEPGPGGFRLRPVSLDLSFEETFGLRYPDAYERLLMDVVRGNSALFMRRDEIETAWEWIDGIVAGWQRSRDRVDQYVAGSWGPASGSLLLGRDGREWYPESIR